MRRFDTPKSRTVVGGECDKNDDDDFAVVAVVGAVVAGGGLG